MEQPVAKKSRYDIASNSILEPHIERVESFADLPPEMLERILNNVSTCDLLNCRRVNYQWNQISSRIMRGHDYIIYFVLVDGKYVQKNYHQCCLQCSLCLCKLIPVSSSKSLTDLVTCFENSALFPFTCFRFDGMSMESLIACLSHFLPKCGSDIRFLSVKLEGSEEIVEIMLKLLFQKVPNLKNLTLLHDPQISRSTLTSIPSIVPLLVDSHQLQLPQLEVLTVSDPSRVCSTIVEKILTASPNLKVFSMLQFAGLAADLEMLNKSNKLHCLKDLEICITEDLIVYWKESQNRFDLQLRSLTLSFDDIIYLDHQLNASASEIISQLFRSSGDSIQTLVTPPLGPMTGLVLPKLEQMRQLRLREGKDDMFPLASDWPDKFPNLKELEIELFNDGRNAIFDHSLKSLPSIESLRVTWLNNGQVFGELIKRTPNVKTLSIIDDSSFVSGEVPQPILQINIEDISLYLPKLENLSWQFQFADSLRNKLDAMITGLPEECCKKLARNLRNDDHLSVDEASIYWNQRHPSFLDLKGLKNLHFHFYKCPYYSSDDIDDDGGNQSTDKDSAGFDPESIFYETDLSKVSKFLVFDQMPELNVVIHKTK